MKARILEHLSALVACNTSDPPSTMHGDDPIIRYCRKLLANEKFETSVEDLGSGQVYLFASRGDPKMLLNCHLDTVAAAPGWTGDPFKLEIVKNQNKAFALGACDIKGAAACMLTALQSSDQDIAILFNTDEEAGYGLCIEHFLKTNSWKPNVVIVAEPTNGKAVLGHRGFVSAELIFSGVAAHTSMADSAIRSAAHDSVRFCASALELTESAGPLSDTRFNIGVIEGGSDANVVNSRTRVHFSFRPRPGQNGEDLIDQLAGLALPESNIQWREKYIAAPLVPCSTTKNLIQSAKIPSGDDVDFWTEAALFNAAGLPAFVLGPGDIAQAHQPDEWVSLDQLETVMNTYLRMINSDVLESTHAS